MDYLDRIRQENPVLSYEHELRKSQINQLFCQAIEFVSYGKLYGMSIDIENLEEVIAALYAAYTTKEMMVKSDV